MGFTKYPLSFAGFIGTFIFVLVTTKAPNDFPKLKSTPIREIVIGISYDGAINIEDIDLFCSSEKIIKEFPLSNPSLQASNKDDASKKSNKPNLDGYLLRDANPPKKILKVKVGSLSLHIVKHYEPLSVLVDEVISLWSALSEHVEKSTITNVLVRYVNWFPNPEGEPITKFTRIHPVHPFDSIKPECFTNIRFTRDEINISCVAAEGKIDGEQGVVLDNTIRKDVGQKDDINDVFKTLRDIKNEVFFKAVTEEALKPYLYE